MHPPKTGRALAEVVLGDPELRDELLDKYPSLRPTANADADLGLESVGSVAEPVDDFAALLADQGLEAIVEQFGRPSLLIVGSTFEDPESEEWKGRLVPYRDTLAASFPSVGRVEIRFHAEPQGGTGWMVAPDIAVTNRHVARIFAKQRNGIYPFGSNPDGQQYEVAVDFLEEHDELGSYEISVAEVLFISDDLPEEPDLAFLRLETSDGREIPAPLQLSDRPLVPGTIVVNVGYPAFDTRQDAADQERIFRGVYGKKRLAPGKVRAGRGTELFSHDCTTLGGSSGSVLLDPDSGQAVGLHFAGRRGIANYAVTAQTVARYLSAYAGGRTARSVMTAASSIDASQESPATVDELADRQGYSPTFLGEDFPVPLPAPKHDVVLPVDGAGPTNELRYHHYSVVMHRDRRMALLTAVNIDGTEMRRVKRGHDRWYFDPRIAQEHQLGNELYERNPLDKGHLVRRLDPAWGSENEVDQAVADTFYWTNSSPQHAQLNRRTWVSLEDYILDNASTHGFRASIFTGPIFQDDDPTYRDLTQIPQAFWKIAVMLKEVDDDLVMSATGYILSQADLLTDLEFAYGPFQTFQVPLERVSRLASLEVPETLMNADPMAGQESTTLFRELSDVGDLVL